MSREILRRERRSMSREILRRERWMKRLRDFELRES